MSKEVDFYFDFASPNAYLSHKVMQSIKERTGAKVNYIPVLLGGIFKLTNNKPPMEQFFGVKNKNEYQNIEMQRFIQRHGLEKFQMNPHFPVISLQIIRGAVAADMDGYLEDYIDKKQLRFMGAGAAYSVLAMEQAIKDSGLSSSEISHP